MGPSNFPWRRLLEEPVNRIFMRVDQTEICADIRVLERPQVQFVTEEVDLAHALWQFAKSGPVKAPRSLPPVERPPKKLTGLST
ncbi:MAG TPA: hypothetical protein VG944_18065 [Fimbriimonas sp.]|nr:hypothetical protein [Fimbriimonas sp.]